MTKPTTYREKRRDDSVRKYLNGKARRPYVLREDLINGFAAKDRIDDKKEKIENKRNTKNSSPCTCEKALVQFSGMFKKFVHSNHKLNNNEPDQEPKMSTKAIRSIKEQNKWLVANVFDSYGNYLFCCSCIKKILRVGGTRLHRLREIKRQEANEPIIRIRKEDVPMERLCDVVLPVNEPDVLTWWINLEDNSIIELRSPPKLHRGKSNNCKEILLPRFLEFIDKNSQPNGRRVGSHGPLFFLNSKFDRINAPSKSEKCKPEQWKSRSLVYEFNRTLEDNKSISNGTAKKWLKAYRPKHAISPKKTDYCEMCIECQEQKRRHEAISMRLLQNGNSDEDEILENKALAESYGLLLEEHKMDAASELQHYRQETDKCRSLYQSIEKLQNKSPKTKEGEANLQKIRKQMVFSLSLDYQQAKLTPHWGFSAQPSETYYLRKLSHNIFGIVNHALGKNSVYVLDERIAGAKNGNITISLIDKYIDQKLPSWARNLCLFMDNGATNKNQFMLQWGMELVEKGDFDMFRMCFFVPGHAKNDVDRLFARISHSFNNNDVFNTQQLVSLIQDTIEPAGSCLNINNRDLVNWKALLTNKYASFKNIKNYRDYLIKRNDQGKTVVYYKACCYHGEYKVSSLLKKNVDADFDLTNEVSNYAYEPKEMSPELSQEKIRDLVKMYDKFIDPTLRPKWLPKSKSIPTPRVTISSPSSALACQHRETLKKKRRKKMDKKYETKKCT
jgi:hypothetical protein